MEIIIDDNPLGRKKDNSGWEDNWDFRNLKYCDIVFVNNISNFGGPYTARVVGKAKEAGKMVNTDTDDLLHGLSEKHKLYNTYKNLKLDDIIKFVYSHSDLVTVTQNKFAERVKPYCTKFLAVIKNAIDYRLPAWNQPKRPSKKCRIGYAAGIHHAFDLEHFKDVPTLVNQKCGVENIKWNLYGHPPPDPNNPKKKDWQWDQWQHYLHRFFGNMKGNKNYEVFMALPPSDYGVYYSDMDIAIAPLVMTEFNDSKSDIKVAEAGRYSIPLVASNVGCYEDTIINGKTGYLIDPDAPKIEWVKILSRLIRDKKHREELGRNLHSVTEELFDLNKVVGQRLKIYEEVFKVIGDPRKNRNKEPNND